MTYIARDLKLYYDPIGYGEWADTQLSTGDFESTNDLENMVLFSLFCDARVEPGTSYDKSPHGFIGNDMLGYNLGSRLWLLDRSKLTKETFLLYAQYSKEALEWLVDEGIASKVETYARKQDGFNDRLELFLAIYRPDENIEQFLYRLQWQAQAGV